MKVLLARHSGFCDGVKRAMRLAMEAAGRSGGLEADGPLVHNRQAVRLLELHGVSSGAAAQNKTLPLLVRAHGIPPEKRSQYESEGRRIVDATCVHVARNQRLARERSVQGWRVVFAGDKEHAEAKAVAGSAGADCLVISSVAEAGNLPSDKPIFFLAQTTFDAEQFHAMSRIVKERRPDALTMDTICRATHDRQREAARLAARSDALVVVGGRDSANTRRLAEAGEASGKPVFRVETADELVDGAFANFRVVAVISGASTPGWLTQDVVNRLRGMGRTPFFSQGMRLLQALVESRATLALSAGGLALGAGLALSHSLPPAHAIMGAAYVFFAHTLNRRVPHNPEARVLSPIDSFYQARRSPFLAMAWLAAGIALALSLLEGAATAGVYALLILATIGYALLSRLAPALKKPTMARNWPMAAGWALALGLPPAFQNPGGVAAFLPAAFVFLVCLGGTLVRDLHDIVSDKLMGIDTIPARIGVSASLRLAARSLGAACFLPFLAAGVAVFARGEGFSPWFLFILLCPLVPALGFWLLRMAHRRKLLDAVVVQAGVDGMGVLAGLLATALGVWT